MQSLSSELAHSVLDAAPDAMVVIDDAGAIRAVNRQVAVLFGYSHDELIGKPVRKVVVGRIMAAVLERQNCNRNRRPGTQHPPC